MPAEKVRSPREELAALAENLIGYLRFARENRLLARVTGIQENDSLEKIAKEIRKCQQCPLYESRRRAVPGEGPASAILMVIGEGPGRQENEQGRPFVGEAGQMLSKMLKAIDYPREKVFVTNIVKCRPPDNRDPHPEEIEACHPFLQRQISQIKPLAILSLGRFAAQTLLKSTQPISRLRGKRFPLEGTEVHPTFHPAYLLRNPGDKIFAWKDLQQLQARLEDLIGEGIRS